MKIYFFLISFVAFYNYGCSNDSGSNVEEDLVEQGEVEFIDDEDTQNKLQSELTHSELTANPTRYGLVANTSSLDEKTQNKCDKLKARLEKSLGINAVRLLLLKEKR